MMKTLGNRIKWARERAELTQSELATRVKVAAGSRVSEWENDRRQPSAPVLMLLPGELGISGHWLLTGEGPRTQSRRETASDEVVRAIQRISQGDIPTEIVRMLADPSASAYLTGARRAETPRIPEPAVPSAIMRRKWLSARIEHHEAPYYLDFENIEGVPGASAAQAHSEAAAPVPVKGAEARPDPERGEASGDADPSIYEGGYVWGHLAH